MSDSSKSIWTTFERSVPDCDEGLKGFYQSLAAAVRWVTYYMDDWPQDEAPYYVKSSGIEVPMLSDSCFDTVSFAVGQRRQYLDGHPAASAPANADEGRLLAYFLHSGGCDPQMWKVTHEFLDTFFMPPPATWVGMFTDARRAPFFNTYLVAWIPDLLVDLVEKAMESDGCDDCIQWLENTENALSIQLFGDRYGRMADDEDGEE